MGSQQDRGIVPPDESEEKPIPDDTRRDIIGKMAYRMYENRDYEEGHAEEDWLEAERLFEGKSAL
jgi:hypothetical protein